jgi:hypothetical protein
MAWGRVMKVISGGTSEGRWKAGVVKKSSSIVG